MNTVSRPFGTQALQRLWQVAALLVVGVGHTTSASAEVDAADARELQVGSTAILLRSLDDEVTGYSVVLSGAQKTGRELLIQNERVVSGARSRRLWQWPKDALVKNVFAELSQQLAGATLFECAGADCGRSNVWSTLVFSEPLSYGPSRYQYYRVVLDEVGELHVLYAVRRGNRRVHVLYERIAPAVRAAETGGGSSNIVAALAAGGVAQLDVIPASDGGLSAAAGLELERIGGQLAGFGAGEIYAVCHLYPAGLPRTVGGKRKERGTIAKEDSAKQAVGALLAASERCAAAATNFLNVGLAAATFDGVAEQSKNRQRPDLITFKSFGVGPLQPVAGAFNRIELIVPLRFVRE